MRQFCKIFFLLFFLSCTSSDRLIPKEILPINRMKLIMWDMTQAGELATLQSDKDSLLLKKNTFEFFQRVLNVHKVNKDEFYTSFKFYENHPVLNKTLLDSVYAYGNRKREQVFRKTE